MKTIGIVGSRSRNSIQDLAAVSKAFMEIYEYGDRMVSGGCPKGGDKFADDIARGRGMTIITHYPEWYPDSSRYPDKSAGFKRNTKIAQDADVLIACVSADRAGGTEDTIRKFVAFKHKDPILV